MVQAMLPPLQLAAPSAQRENFMQQPDATQVQFPGSTNTEWQSLRASQSASVVTAEHEIGQFTAGQGGPATPGGLQPTYIFCPWQPGQYCGPQPWVIEHAASLSPWQTGGGGQSVGAGHCGRGLPTWMQPANAVTPQVAQVATWQSVRAAHASWVRPTHGSTQAIAGQISSSPRGAQIGGG
jgi:hypothetical protein